MAIQPVCDACNSELSMFGAIVLSPPDDQNQVRKYHLCVSCYQKLPLPD